MPVNPSDIAHIGLRQSNNLPPYPSLAQHQCRFKPVAQVCRLKNIYTAIRLERIIGILSDRFLSVKTVIYRNPLWHVLLQIGLTAC